jgi:hypothetical protein
VVFLQARVQLVVVVLLLLLLAQQDWLQAQEPLYLSAAAAAAGVFSASQDQHRCGTTIIMSIISCMNEGCSRCGAAATKIQVQAAPLVHHISEQEVWGSCLV